MLGIHLRISTKNWCVNASFQYLILRISVFHQDNMTFDIHLLRWVNQFFMHHMNSLVLFFFKGTFKMWYYLRICSINYETCLTNLSLQLKVRGFSVSLLTKIWNSIEKEISILWDNMLFITELFQKVYFVSIQNIKVLCNRCFQKRKKDDDLS